ncbi:zinc finger BED domain-containing protein 5 [Trichonephila clavipes]|nr:zinc finger BED domain-containing protein 5 [Trichonephila clavipes]
MFGVNVSPFLLSATIKHHIENYREQYPAATKMLDTCLYVDDVISGADDISQALKVSKDAETIMKNASMKLRKWNSNDQTLMRTWEKEGLETHPRHPDDSSKIPSSKVLGIPWDVVHDYFTIDVKGLLQLDTSKPITKELCFNQLGKYTIQLGSCHPTQLGSNAYYKNFGYGKLKIPRKILDSSGDSSEIQIHTFSDASQKAYGAAAFLRVKHKDRVSVDLVTSKSRVAPLKRLSLPRLELMGALLAARLAKEVKKILDQKCSTRAFFWTDSQVTLHWIKGPSYRWKPFVANRVREIQSLTDPNSWFHCSGKDNPADLLTRGISVDALTTNSKWWNGSSFLRQIDFQTKGLDEAIPERVYLTEMRKNSNQKEDISLTLTVTKNNFLENVIDISNNYVKLIRVVSFLYRFIHNCRTRITKIKGPLTSQEVSHAENWLIHSLHEREFYVEMRKLLAARCKKPHTIAEELILPAAIEIVETMFGDNFAKELQSIPLSNDTVSRRIDDIAEDVEKQLFGKLRDKLFSIQLDEATDSNKDAHFIAYVRFWDASYEWVRDPFQNTPEGLSTTEEESFIDFTSSGEIKRQFCNKTLFQFWAEVDDEFSELKTKAFRILLPFSTSYLCETGFSAVAALKTKYRSQLNIEKELRVSISNIKPSFENLCSARQAHGSH